jgi:hypothetical protein
MARFFQLETQLFQAESMTIDLSPDCVFWFEDVNECAFQQQRKLKKR